MKLTVEKAIGRLVEGKADSELAALMQGIDELVTAVRREAAQKIRDTGWGPCCCGPDAGAFADEIDPDIEGNW